MIKRNRQYRFIGDEDQLPVFDKTDDGLPVIAPKKKEEPWPLTYKREKTSSVPSLLSGSHPLLSSEKPITDAVKQVKSFKKSDEFLQPADQTTYQKAQDKLNDIMYSDKWEDPVKELNSQIKNAKTNEDLRVLNEAANITRKSLAPSGVEAKRILSESHFGSKDETNETANLLKDRAVKYDKTVGNLRKIERDLSQATPEYLDLNYTPQLQNESVKYRAEHDSQFKRNLQDLGIDLQDPDAWHKLPAGFRGQTMAMYLNDPDVEDYLSKENPSLLPAFERASKTLLTDDKDYGINVVANEVSQAIEKSGYNKIEPLFNYASQTTKNFANQIAEQIYRDNPQKKEIYDKYIKGNEENYLDVPSFFEGFAQAGKDVMGGIKSTFTVPFKSREENIKDQWIKEASHVSANPEGLVKHLRDIGHATGFVSSLVAGGNVLGALSTPATAQKLLVGTTMFGDLYREAQTKYQSPVKALTSAGVQTLGYVALSEIFPSSKIQKIFADAKPQFNKIATELTSGKISKEAARMETNNVISNVVDFAKKAGIQNLKTSGEMTALTIMNQGMDKLMGLDKETFEKYHPDGEALNTFKTMFLSNSLVAGVSSFAENKTRLREAKDIVYEMASKPKEFSRMIDNLAVTNRDIKPTELKNTLKVLSEAKAELNRNRISESEQKTYLLHAKNELDLKQKAEQATEPTIKKRYEEEAKKSAQIKEGILKGLTEEQIVKRQAIKDVKDLYNEGFLGKGSMEMLESKETLEGNPKFDEDKVMDYLKFVAEQANNIVDGKFNEAADSRKATERQYTSQVIDLANEVYPEYKKIAEEYDNLKTIKDEQLNETSNEEMGGIGSRQETGQEIGSEGGEQGGLETRPSERPEDNVKNKKEKIRITADQLESLQPKKEQDALQESGSTSLLQYPQEGVGETRSERERMEQGEQGTTPAEEKGKIEGQEGEIGGANPPPPELKNATAHVEQPTFRLIKSELERVRAEMGIDDYVTDKVSHLEAITKAHKTIQEWKDKGIYEKEMNKIIEQALNRKITDEGQNILAQYIADLRVTAKGIKDRNSAEYNNILSKLNQAVEAGDVLRSEAGRILGRNVLKMRGERIDSVLDVELDMMNDYGVNELTPSQKAEAERRFNDLDEKLQKEETLRKQAEDEIQRLNEEIRILKEKKESSRDRKKTDAEYKKERTDLIESIKKKWKNAGKDILSSDIPYRKQLAAITPDVFKLIRSYLVQGYAKTLEDVRKLLKKDIQDAGIDIQYSDVRSLIAGEFSEKKYTLSEISREVQWLRKEEKLLLELERLEAGEVPVSEKKKVQVNQRIKEIRDKITEIQRERKIGRFAEKSDQEKFEKTIKQQIEKNKNKQKELERKIKEKDFEDEAVKKSILENSELQKKNKKLYDEYLKSVVEKDKALMQYEKDRLNDQIKNHSAVEKILDYVDILLASSKGTVAMFDQSGVLVQMLLTSLSHPLETIKMLPTALRDLAGSKRFDESLAKFKNSKIGEIAKKSDLAIYDPEAINENVRNELLGGGENLWNRDITIGGKKFSVGKAVERSTSTLFNTMRAYLFENRVNDLYKQGKTFETHPEEFKAAARAINEITGHGKVEKHLAMASPVLNRVIWSPKMISSTMNVLGLGDIVRPVPLVKEIGKALGIKGIKDSKTLAKGFYSGLTPTQRKFMAMELVRAIGSAAVIMIASRLTGLADDVDLNPLSSSFGSIKSGDKSINVFGRYGSAIRALSQMALGKRIVGGKEDILGDRYGDKKVADVGFSAFVRGKMTPAAGLFYDWKLGGGQNYFTHEKITPLGAAKQMVVPISFQEMSKDFSRDGAIKGVLETLLKIYGGNISDQRDFQKNSGGGQKRGPKRNHKAD